MRHSLHWVIGILLPLTTVVDSTIHPGEVWLDDRGQPIQAHGATFLSRLATPTTNMPRRSRLLLACRAIREHDLLCHWH